MHSGYVSIIGRPNVGKSTLLNRYVGEKVAAVSPRPQTTRNRILGARTGERGQIIFVDTPGIHKPHNEMHKRMVAIAVDAINGMDAVLLVVDATLEFGAGDRFVLDTLREHEALMVLAINKIDLIKKIRILPLIDLYAKEHDFRAIVPISAADGDGLDQLEAELLALLPEREPLFPADYVTDQPERAFAAEIIREKVFLHTRSEVPYCSAVVIDVFEDKGKSMHIAASIIVERESQKGIVIGKGGAMLKRIGSEARKELEAILAVPIYIELWVKVKIGWRDDLRVLKELGLEE